MFDATEELEPNRSKVKTQQKTMTLQQIKTDASNYGKYFLSSGLKIQLGKPVRFPIIKKGNRKQSRVQECYSSRTSNQAELNPNISAQDKTLLLESETLDHDRSSSLVSKTLQRNNPKAINKDRSLDAVKHNHNQQSSGQQKLFQRKALPKIFKFKCFKENEHHQRMKSQKDIDYSADYQLVKRYRLGRILGQGGNAIVREAQHESGKVVAIKTYSKDKLRSSQKRQSIKRQIDILSRVIHPNIIQLIETIQTQTSIHIVTQLVQGTSLLDHIKSNVTNKLNQSQARKIFIQIVHAIHYLHQKQISHRDIKLQNILIDRDKKVKIIDFGFAHDSQQKLDIFCGTPSYIAPQIILKKGYYGKPVDVWACGILLFRMLCGMFPFKGLNQKTLYNKISKGMFRFGVDISMNAQILINKMLTSQTTSRAKFDEILRQPWLQQKC